MLNRLHQKNKKVINESQKDGVNVRKEFQRRTIENNRKEKQEEKKKSKEIGRLKVKRTREPKVVQ